MQRLGSDWRFLVHFGYFWPHPEGQLRHSGVSLGTRGQKSTASVPFWPPRVCRHKLWGIWGDFCILVDFDHFGARLRDIDPSSWASVRGYSTLGGVKMAKIGVKRHDFGSQSLLTKTFGDLGQLLIFGRYLPF